jgi:hypothetical protein
MVPLVQSPVICEPLARILPRFGGSMAITPVDSPLIYALPENAAGEVSDFLNDHAVVEVAPGFVARLPGGRVFGSGNVLSPDGRSVARDVSPDFGKPFSDHWLLSFKRFRSPVPLPGDVAVIASTLGRGYSHWLLEELPRLLLLGPKEVAAIIAHGVSACSREALRLHGFRGRLIEPGRETHFSCEQLIIPSLPGEAGRPVPSVVGLLEEFTAPLHASSSAFGERLYISRGKARRRLVSNEDALWSQLEQQGFSRVYLEDYTWAQQINAFRHARVIVAPHGAGLANLIFCRPGTRVVEFFHPAYVNPCFWRLAALRGLDYRPTVDTSLQSLRCDRQCGRLDIEADVKTILNLAAC